MFVRNQLVFLKISLQVWSEDLVNSVKIDGDGEASDFENDVVENDFILSNDKNDIHSFTLSITLFRHAEQHLLISTSLSTTG